MKRLILFTVAAATLAFTTAIATASSAFNITGTAVFNNTNYVKGTNYISTTTTLTFNNAFIYNLISNAVANASNGSNNLAATLPANGYIVYFPEGSDGKYNGFFYVTDSKGFYYQLSGYDVNGIYYNFMRLIASDWLFGSLGSSNAVVSAVIKPALTITPAVSGDDCCDCCCPSPLSVYVANFSEMTGAGKYSATDIASIRIHTIPYWTQHNDLNSLDLSGILKPEVSFKDLFLNTPSTYYLVSPSTATFTGYGNIVLTQGSELNDGIVPAVTVKFNF